MRPGGVGVGRRLVVQFDWDSNTFLTAFRDLCGPWPSSKVDCSPCFPPHIPQNGGTPLYAAALSGHKDVVQLLLAAKANTEAQNEVGGWRRVKRNINMHPYCPCRLIINSNLLNGTWARGHAAVGYNR